MHEKFELVRSQRQFARLLKLSQEQEKALAENPKPFLDKAYAELSRHRRLLDDIKAAASGVDEMLTPPPPGPPPYEPIERMFMRRLQRIQKLLNDEATP